MRIRTTVNQQKKQEALASIPEQAREAAERTPGIFELLGFGSRAVIRQAIEEEITQFLGRESYERLKEGGVFLGERNGSRQTTIDTPIGALTYDRPRLAYAPDFKSAYH